MTQVVIENPIINSPFDKPARHFKFSDDGITNEIVETRRKLQEARFPVAKTLETFDFTALPYSFQGEDPGSG